MYTNTSDAQLRDHWRARRGADAFAELAAGYGPLVYSACRAYWGVPTRRRNDE